jgi:adenine-specific DNA methylase
LEKAKNKRPIPMKQRKFLAASPEIADLFNQASQECRARRNSHPNTFPDELISVHDRADDRLISYGYRRWTDLFNHRQLLHLSHLAEAIQKLDEPVRTPMVMAFSDHLTTNCMLTSYAAGWRRLTPLFSLRSFRHIPRPVELNPWVDRTGRGSFPNTVRKLMRAANFARMPKEPLSNGTFMDVPLRSPEKRGEAICGSARDLNGFADRSIDIVLSDPPYFDNIAYSELAEFFHPWLKMLGGISPKSTLEQVKLESLVGRRKDPDTLESYEKGLCEAFGEISRVLKETGILMFSFRHILPEVWHALAQAIASNALEPIRVLPTPGESGIGLHAHSGTGLWDAVLILKKGNDTPSFSNDLDVLKAELEDIVKQVDQWTNRLKKSPLPFTQVDRTTIWRATLVMASLKRRAATRPESIATLPLLQALRQQP